MKKEQAVKERDPKELSKDVEVQPMIDVLVAKAEKALEAYMAMDQAQVDAVVKAMTLAGIDRHMELAKMAVEETQKGVYEDKIIKNLFATEYIYHSIEDLKTVGVIEENRQENYIEIAEPVGVIAGVTPVTNPTSTTMFKAIIAAKTRNPIVFAFHPSAQKCSALSAKILRDAAVAAGAPEDCIQWIDVPSLQATQLLMRHPGISLILATGGAGMVESAYSTGKPALGVGPGNVPCFIEASANVKRSVTDLILSKTFDNGMICASEQGVILEAPIADAAIEFMKDNGCYFLEGEELAKVESLAIDSVKCAMSPKVVGRSACDIAAMAGVMVPEGTKILVAPLQGIGPEYPLSREKLSPILALYVVDNAEAGIRKSEEMVAFGGLGHSAVIHSNNDALIREFSERVKVGRVIVNAPSSHGAIGDLYNTNMPSLTLGCGSYGRNSTTANVSAVNLINKKRVAQRRVNMQWFKIPEKIYFQAGSVRYLEDMPEISRAIIVTDPQMVKLGYVDRVLYFLRKRQQYVHCEIFSEVEPDPSVETVKRGAKMMHSFQPDVIIALGGGSAIDAAKGMWLFYEHPEMDFTSLRLKFMDIRKRAFKYPKLGSKVKMVAIPTTSGTGSEVTSFTVITDQETNTKYPLADYELTPDVAILDPDFVMTVPPQITADTGMDVLTHAMEAYVSVLASDYTDALAIKAIQMVFEYLQRAYRDGSDKLAREKMHNASCIAGMAFTNAFLGVNHSLAHKLGGEFHIPHGRANAILLPHVIRYNAAKPSKFVAFPKYETYVAHEKYAEIARALALPSETTEQGVASLIQAVRDLMKSIDMPQTLAECGIMQEVFETKIPMLADKALGDQCTTANPRMPLVSELEGIYREAYGRVPAAK